MTETLQLLVNQIDTPIGELMIVADHDGSLRAIDWVDHEPRMRQLLNRHYGKNSFQLQPNSTRSHLAESLRSYFAGDLSSIESLPVRTAGTPFQQAVWSALREIPCSTTISYAQLAERIGRPAAVRAVGLANGSNPISIVVPCHRVIGSNGSLTGYGGGIARKRWLLEHEGQSPTNLVLT
jgi:methylated-DNA-[protein]-cysteine S-methyltransferase